MVGFLRNDAEVMRMMDAKKIQQPVMNAPGTSPAPQMTAVAKTNLEGFVSGAPVDPIRTGASPIRGQRRETI